jgi:ADP-heptose:LPS heptosyltransferase
VLLIRLRSIGDTVLMTPCLEALHQWQPAIEIAVVSEPLAAPILDGHPLVDRLFVVGKSTGARVSAIARIRRWKPEAAFNLHGGSTGMIIAALSGAYYSVGYRDQRGSGLLTTPVPAPDEVLGRKEIHSVEQQLALLYWSGVPWPQHPRVSVVNGEPNASASLRQRLLDLGITASSLESKRIAFIAPGAAFESKRWRAEGFTAVVNHLAARDIQSIVIAGPGQETLAREVAASARDGAPVLSGITLNELMVLFGMAGIFIGNDSGLMHLAAAAGCPTVAVFGSSNPDVWHPWTDAVYRVLGGERGKPDCDVRGSIDSIEAGSVIAAIDEVLIETRSVHRNGMSQRSS